MSDFFQEAQQLFEYTQNLRRDFHQHPELGFQEVRTAGIVARELTAQNLEISTGVAETGVVALIEGKQPGPVVLLRVDMDALPIQEATGAEYASQTPGIMHACGHDGHTAIGLTVARLLNAHRDQFSGTVKLVFQPAEEGMGGATRMVAEGILENPRPDFALALHIWNDKPVGWIGVTEGPAMAGAEVFEVKITGNGGHGAAPHLAKDPVLAAIQAVSALQSIVSRNVHPLESAVISVTSVHAGEAFNVIPSTALFRGTIRTFKPEIREVVLTRFREVVKGVTEAMGCQAEIELQQVTHTVVNTPEMARKIQAIASEMFPDGELQTDLRTMGSEDMSEMMKDFPGCYFFVGGSNSERGLDAPHHHPWFDFDERVLPKAVGLMTAAAMEFLKA